MAEYAARWDEFEDGIKATEEKDIDPAKDEIEILPILTRYTGFTNSMSKYMDWRDKALSNALPILKNESTSITGSAQKDKWSEYFEKQGQEALKMILGFVPDDDKTPKLRLFAEAMATQESAFFAKLSSIPLAWFQGQIQEYTYQFYTEMNSLEDKWKNLQNMDKAMDSKVKDTSANILRLFKDIVSELVEQERAGEQALINTIKASKLTPGLPLSMKAVLTAVQLILSKAQSFQKSIDDMVNIYMDAYKREETVVILFAQTRNAVREFLQKTNLDSASDEFEETCKNSLDMAKQCKTKGQQEDAVRFVENGIKLIKDFYEDFKKQYEEFVDDNRGIFVGPVGDKAIEEILEKRDMEYSWQEISRFNIQQKLKDIHTDAVRSWHVDINGLTDEQKKEIEDFWRVELEKLGRGLQTIADGSTWDRTKQIFTRNREQLEDKISNSKGGLQ